MPKRKTYSKWKIGFFLARAEMQQPIALLKGHIYHYTVHESANSKVQNLEKVLQNRKVPNNNLRRATRFETRSRFLNIGSSLQCPTRHMQNRFNYISLRNNVKFVLSTYSFHFLLFGSFCWSTRPLKSSLSELSAVLPVVSPMHFAGTYGCCSLQNTQILRSMWQASPASSSQFLMIYYLHLLWKTIVF